MLVARAAEVCHATACTVEFWVLRCPRVFFIMSSSVEETVCVRTIELNTVY